MNEVLDGPVAHGGSIASRVEETMRAVLPALVSLRVTGAQGGMIELALNGQRLTARWVREGWLPAIQQVLDEQTPLPDVVVARTMSPGSRSALSDAGIGWVDETGAAEVVVGSIIISRSGTPKGKSVPRWTRSVLAVAEAVLCGTKATVAGVADATGLSTGTCANALHTLKGHGLLGFSTARGPASARHIVDMDWFLAAYVEEAESLMRPLSLQVGVTWEDAIDGLAACGRKWDEQGTAWAASGPVAAAVMAPLLTLVRSAIVYVDADTPPKLEAVAAQAGLRPIEGGRLTLAPFPTTTTRSLSTSADGLRVAPWPRVFADLRRSGVRGEEAAEHLREVVGA
jgi:hypothetical protein